MSTTMPRNHVSSRTPRPHAAAGIVFGSAATAPAKKPDSVRATCEAIGLARSTYYYQSHRSASAVIDAWSREVVGYAASLQVTNRLARIALHSAVRSHRPAPGCIHHSTCGTQYLTRSYCELLRQYGLIPSIGEAAGRVAMAAHEHSSPASPREIVNILDYQTWKDVIDRPREFIQTLVLDRTNRLAVGKTNNRRAGAASRELTAPETPQATRTSRRVSVPG